MIYVWAGIAVVVLFLIWQIIRWWNLPATIEARQKAAEARAKRWADWRANRPRIIPRRNPSVSTPPQEKPSTPDTAEAIKRIQEESEAKRRGLRERIKQRRAKRREQDGN